MKKLLLLSAIICAVIALPAFAQEGNNDNLLQALHSPSQDLAPAPYAPTEGPPTGSDFSCTPGKGVAFTTKDKAFSIRFCGFTRIAYSYTNYDEDRSDARLATIPASSKANGDVSSISFPMVRFRAMGHVGKGKKMRYFFEIDPRDAGKSMKDTWIEYKTWYNEEGDALYFRIGQFKSAFGRGMFNSGFARIFIHPNIVERNFAYARSPSAAFQGTFMKNRANFILMARNGTGEDGARTTTGTNMVGRVWYDFADKAMKYIEGRSMANEDFKCSVGFAGFYDNDATTTSTANRGDVWSAETDITVRGNGFYGQVSYFWRQVRPDAASTTFDGRTQNKAQSYGWYLQGSYCIKGKYELAARYSYISFSDPNSLRLGAYKTAIFKDTATTSVNGDMHELSLGVNYYLDGFNAKISAEINYRMLDPNSYIGAELIQDTEFGVGFQLKF